MSLRPRSRLAIVAVVALSSAVAFAHPVGAFAPVSTVTTVPDVSSSTTEAPPESTTTSASTDPTASTDTTVATGSTGADAPQYQNDDDLVGRGFYAGQGAFDPASKLAVPQDVSRARSELARAERHQREAETVLADTQQQAAALQTELAQLEAGQQQAIADAAKAKAAFADRAVQAYMQGRESESYALLDSGSPIEYARRTQLLSAVLDADVNTAADYQQRRDALSSDLQSRLDAVDTLNRQVAQAQADAATATLVAQAADAQARTFANGSQLWVPGFVFPVAGPVEFVDSFGYPRLVGTGQQHWHEGCDVMSPMGTPLVAVEDGTVTKVGANSLGGLSLKITGVSGYWYYYAHLSAFAPGLVEGAPILAGTLVGYVGNTGDAAGGPTHLHFEAHRPDGKVLDSFGLLKTAWQDRQAQLLLGGVDPVSPPDPATHPDPGTIGGFPRFPDGRPVYADPAQQPVVDPNATGPLPGGAAAP